VGKVRARICGLEEDGFSLGPLPIPDPVFRRQPHRIVVRKGGSLGQGGRKAPDRPVGVVDAEVSNDCFEGPSGAPFDPTYSR